MQTQSLQKRFPKKRRTRADFYRDQVQVRLAMNEAGPMIADVLKANGIELPGADWSNVMPWWLIATKDDEVIGCVQAMPVKPIGYVNFLHVAPSASFKMRAIALRKLALAAISSMHYAGVHYVAGVIGPENKKFLNVLQKLGFAKLSDGVVMIKYISGETMQ